MKQEAEAKIAHLESELLRWKANYMKLHRKLRNTQEQRNKFVNESANLKKSLASVTSERDVLHFEQFDSKDPHDSSDTASLESISPHPETASSSKSESPVCLTPEAITVDSDANDNVKSNAARDESNANERSSTPSLSIGGWRRSVFAGVELRATSMLKKQALNNNPPKTTPSKRAFGKSNADHPSAESPKKKPKVHPGQELPATAPRKVSLWPNSPVPPGTESDACVQPEHAIQISSSPDSRSGLSSSSRSISLSDLTSALSATEDASGEEESELGTIQEAFPVAGPSRIPGPPHIRHPSSASAHQPGVDIRSKYLQGVPTFDIHPHPSITCVSRQFLNHKFGGGEMQFTGVMDKIGSKRNHVMFPKERHNPLMPSIPGAPGLIYTARTDLTDHPVWRMFGFIQGSSKPAVWKYLGNYSLSYVGNLTPAEFRSQLPRVQNSLVEAIFRFNWRGYPHMRARMYLRKHGRVVNDAAVRAELDKFETKAKCHYGNKLTQADVLDALTRGDETIIVLLVTCVGYDHNFSAGFSSFEDYEHRPPPVRRSKLAKKRSARRQGSSVDLDLQSVNSNGRFRAGGSGAGEHEQVLHQRPQRKRNVPQRFVVDVDETMGSSM